MRPRGWPDERHGVRDWKRLTFDVVRVLRQRGVDQLDAPPIEERSARRDRHQDRPAPVVGDPRGGQCRAPHSESDSTMVSSSSSTRRAQGGGSFIITRCIISCWRRIASSMEGAAVLVASDQVRSSTTDCFQAS